MFLLGNMLWTTTNGGIVPPPPPPPAPATTIVGGGIPHQGLYQRQRTKQDVTRDRERFGIPDLAAQVIADIAARQAAALELDAQKRFEELTRELQLQGLAFDARYLEALNTARERLIDVEIGLRLRQRIKDDEEILLMLLMVAASA